MYSLPREGAGGGRIFSHPIYNLYQVRFNIDKNRPELKAFELWILRSMLDLQFLLILRLIQSLVCILESVIQLALTVDCRIRKANQKSRNFEALHTRGLSYLQVTIQ